MVGDNDPQIFRAWERGSIDKRKKAKTNASMRCFDFYKKGFTSLEDLKQGLSKNAIDLGCSPLEHFESVVRGLQENEGELDPETNTLIQIVTQSFIEDDCSTK